MSKQKFQSYESIKKLFNGRTYVHFTTIKPPRGVDKDEQFIKFLEYLHKRDVLFWYVECKSETDFLHYHGVVSYPDEHLPEKMEASKVAFQRKVNRDIGFSYPLQYALDLKKIYEYIHQSSNNPQCEYYTNHIYGNSLL